MTDKTLADAYWARGAAARETRDAWVAAEAAQKERFAKMVDAAIGGAK